MKKIPHAGRIVSIIVLLVIVISAGTAIKRWSVSPDRFIPSTHSNIYHDDSVGFTFSYPSNLIFSAEATGTSTDSLKRIHLSANGMTISLVTYTLSTDAAITERAFAESILFGDPKQKNNFKLTRDEWAGFKSVKDFNKATYALYKNISPKKVFVIRADVESPTNPSFSKAEGLFLTLLSNIVFE